MPLSFKREICFKNSNELNELLKEAQYHAQRLNETLEKINQFKPVVEIKNSSQKGV